MRRAFISRFALQYILLNIYRNGGELTDNVFEERAVMLGRYIAATGATVRTAAKIYGVSKSTVHSDVTLKLRKADPELYLQVRKVLDINKEERHIRGGIATREKYKAVPGKRG